MNARKRCTSLSPLFNDQSSNGDSGAKSGSPLPYIAPWVRAVAIFGLGYGIGGVSAPGWQRHSRVASKIGVTRIALVILILRDLWRSTPQWAKPRISRYGRKVMNIVSVPFRRISGAVDEVVDEIEDEIEDVDDITDFSNFATKIQGVIDVAKKKLELEEDDPTEAVQKSEKGQVRDDFNVQASFLAFVQILSQVKSRRASASSRDQIYRSSGTAVPIEMLEGLDEMFELADLAYDEHKDGSIKEVLNGMGYNLIKHDTTAVPGYLGHYIAINSDQTKEKTAVIGVKGTSNLEDFLTDMCASAVEYNLTNPFYEGGSKTLRCHEGAFISSQRLAEDLQPTIQNLLLPSGYKIILAGHSLGAGCATILSMLLRSSIPSLQDNNNLLKVWAFASPPVLDLNSALGCSSFVTSVVNNCDVVTRANVSPLVVTAGLLRAVNKRLKERNLDMSDFQSTISFLNKIKEGSDGEMLMSADEVTLELDKSLKRSELQDPDHLYLPGKVIVMYDLWEKEQQKLQDQKESQRDYSTILKDWMQTMNDANMHSTDVDLKNITTAEEAILCDGTCKALRFIELDGRLIDDHMAPQYRSSIANILSSRNVSSIEKSET
mmetsp:Transcript_18475/g.39967  ORF Transcript_18475/g.39967 Transcript_18475/m.39967 type:complete len:605 (+) Transcript_18475:343-2157(+)|eukprot:CAMPEP_0172331480 /NCGR_PEP_ID=MMETSP1058-20130122/61951_1 /TAXON_ID=83371 /ORGANISM="Detonula confervacea, Strain CCMP 353" /LENGTH=604 /DNA_ID=CAMNT_0013048749 /DNA_START=286 /DNA_END=2100 /DNA_ORIENTATION=+